MHAPYSDLIFFFMHIRDTRPYSSAKQHVICIGRPGGRRLA
jgi:hypothetical protein